MENFFENLPIETDILSKEFQDFYPQIAITSNINPIQFEISPTYNQLTDPEILIYVEGRVLNNDGTAIEPAGRVACGNLFLHTMFKNVAVKLNNSVTYQANDAYSYKAYIETMFTYSQGGKTSFGGLELFHPDTPGKFNNFDNDNPSYIYRKGKCSAAVASIAAQPAAGNNPAVVAVPAIAPKIRMAGRLHADLFLQKRPIIPGVGISVILLQNDERFRLMADEIAQNQKFVIDSIFLRVFRINLTPSLLLNIERALLTNPAVYYLSRVNVRTHQIPRLTTQISNFLLHNGQVPKYVLLTMVKSQNIDGTFTLNPYEFTLKQATFCQLNVNGDVYPSKPYDVSESWIDPYINLLKVVKKYYADTNIGLTLEDMSQDGYQILAFDLSGDLSGTSAGRHTPMRNGILNLDMRFKGDALVENYTLIAYMCFDSVLQIDSRKNIITNYVA